ncbi:amidohydrolase family protein [Pseudonocardia ailaonensis]|uniref:Amidohydrolase family protein n=1 Tax=Pseudonocardia ailaonensis TaxID=367279 RepID=A0ABN2N3S6_9PSEU
MLTHLIEGATIVDGSGAEPVVGDIGIRDGRIVAVGTVDEEAEVRIDAGGLMAAPGFVDPHTHYDAQLFWDPYLTPSSQHGVTTVIAGNCGFTLAPVKADDTDYIRRLMAGVEGMPLAALEAGLPWTWESFSEYLEQVDRIGLVANAGFMVGHTALRRYVMGTEAGGPAGPEHRARMAALLRECLDAGGLGLSTSRSSTHSDGDGAPVPSRNADPDELLELCRVLRPYDGTMLEAVVEGCLSSFDDSEIELFAAMSTAADKPLNWNSLHVDGARYGETLRQLEASDHAATLGGRVVAVMMPTMQPMNVNFRTHCGLHLLPEWPQTMKLPVPERMVALRDPAVRARMLHNAHHRDVGVLSMFTDFANYTIGDVYSEANRPLRGRRIADIAAERGQEVFDTLLDIVLEDELRTILWPEPASNDDESWGRRRDLLTDERVLLGGSDAGAHLDRMCGAGYPTAFLGDCLRGRRLVPVETAVHLITQVPAALFGLRDRGLIAAGGAADLVLFDPATVGSGAPTMVQDLPADSARLTAEAEGVHAVFVNGVRTVRDGALTGDRPGKVLRSGRDTTRSAATAQ